MDFLSVGIPAGRYFGIPVRLHITFLFYAYYRAQAFGDLRWGLAFVAGLYVCILLHEFGHALAARWCDGDVDHILLWPLGGLAVCRCAWHPTAHLITAAAGPFVTLVLWLLFWGLGQVVPQVFVKEMARLNLVLLIFNLIPAFPMDGGRILRDTIWHGMSAERATRIAVWVSRGIAVTAAALIFVAPGTWVQAFDHGWPEWVVRVGLFCSGNYMLLVLAAFILFQAQQEQVIVGAELHQAQYGFSLKERWQRRGRQRRFYGAVRAQAAEAAVGFHRCASCGRTEQDDRHMDFRVCTECTDGSEYCPEHLSAHTHVALPAGRK
jgi:Zn-dependent protease